MANKATEFELPEGVKMPDEFYKIIDDFISDIKLTFPEYDAIIQRWWKLKDFSHITDDTEREQHIATDKKKRCYFVFRHCIKIIPERFFDILYKNNDIYDEANEVSTEFLPGVVFKHLWSCDISDNTRETIWKYLQLILFSVIGSVHSTSQLGDTAKLFEAINEDELKTKLQETLEGIQNLFSNAHTDTNTDASDDSEKSATPPFQMPNADDIHNHIHGMMEGKLGKLAMELAEETAAELNLDMDNISNAQDVFQTLFANPGKLMNMVKNVGGKIDEKIKSGEIKESELISEGMEMLNRMKGMPGMENMKEMFTKLGVPGLGKHAKLNTGAMEAQLNKNLKMAQMKERIKTNANKKKNAVPVPTCPITTGAGMTDEQLISIFSTGENVEKTPRGAKPSTDNNNNKKKKNKPKK